MALFELFFIVIILFLITINITKDLFSPSSIILLSYILSILCFIINMKDWNYDIHYNTVIIIVVGLLSFLITSFIIRVNRHALKDDIQGNSEDNKFIVREIDVPKVNLLIANTVSLSIMLLYFYFFIKSIGGISKIFDTSNMINYRYNLAFKKISSIPTLVNFLTKYCRALSIVYAYILINNLAVNKFNFKEIKFNTNFLYLINGILIYIPLPLMSGSRFDLIVLLITMFMIGYIMLKQYYNYKIKLYSLVKIIVVFIIVLILFSEARYIVGRTNNSNTVKYISSYLGGSIVSFDMYLQEKHVAKQYVGQEIFEGIRKFMLQISLISETEKQSTIGEFRQMPNGIVIGNVYTAFRKMYNDFKYVGVIVLQWLMAIIYNKMYYSLFSKKSTNIVDNRLIICSSIYYALFLHSYSEFFFSTILSFNYLMILLFVYVIEKFLFRIKIKY